MPPTTIIVKLGDGMRGPDFRFGAHETRAEQPPDGHPCPRGIECSWGFARGFRAAPLSLTSRTYKEQRIWSSGGFGHLSCGLLGFLGSPHPLSRKKSGVRSHERGRAQRASARCAPLLERLLTFERLSEPPCGWELRLRLITLDYA